MKNWTECSLAQHRFPTRFVIFVVSSVCLLVRVTVVDKNKALVCCLLATSAIMLSEKKKRKRKMCSKKWYLKRNISCDAHLLEWIARNGCALRLCHRGVYRYTEETVGFRELTAQFWGLRYWLSKLRSLLSFSARYYTSHSKIAQFNWECIGRFTGSI